MSPAPATSALPLLLLLLLLVLLLLLLPQLPLVSLFVHLHEKNDLLIGSIPSINQEARSTITKNALKHHHELVALAVDLLLDSNQSTSYLLPPHAIRGCEVKDF